MFQNQSCRLFTSLFHSTILTQPQHILRQLPVLHSTTRRAISSLPNPKFKPTTSSSTLSYQSWTLRKQNIFFFGAKQSEKTLIRPPSYKDATGQRGIVHQQKQDEGQHVIVNNFKETVDLFTNESPSQALSFQELAQQYHKFWSRLLYTVAGLAIGTVGLGMIVGLGYLYRAQSYYSKVMKNSDMMEQFLQQQGLYQRYPGLKDLDNNAVVPTYNLHQLETAALRQFIIYHNLATNFLPTAIDKCTTMKDQIDACPEFCDNFYHSNFLLDLIEGIQQQFIRQTTKFLETSTYGIFLHYISSPTPEQRPFILQQLLSYGFSPESLVLSTAGHLSSSIFQIKLGMKNLDNLILIVNSVLDPIWCDQFARHFQLPTTNQSFYREHLQTKLTHIDPQTDHLNFAHLHPQMAISLHDMIGIYTYFSFAFDNLTNLQNTTIGQNNDTILQPFLTMQNGLDDIKPYIYNITPFTADVQTANLQGFRPTIFTQQEKLNMFDTLQRPQPLPSVLSSTELLPIFYPPLSKPHDLQTQQQRSQILPQVEQCDTQGDDERRHVIDFTLMPMLCLENRIERFKYLDIRHYAKNNHYLTTSSTSPLSTTLLPAPFWTYTGPFSMPSISSKQFYKKLHKINQKDNVTLESTAKVEEQLLKQYITNYRLYSMDKIAAADHESLTNERLLHEEHDKLQKEQAAMKFEQESIKVKRALSAQQFLEFEAATSLQDPNAVEAPLNIRSKW